MKRNLSRLVGVCGVFAFLAFAALSSQQHNSDLGEQSARISRIEAGLLTAVSIKGRPAPAMTIADRMSFYKVPGVSVSYFDHGQILWTRTYGLANIAAKKPITSETLFQAASISKPVTALAMLRLVQDGKLSLDEDVNAKLRTWKVPENEFTKENKVTLRRIASHSAGLTVHGFPGYASDEHVPSIIQILNGEPPANTPAVRVDTVPGTLWRYSGGGYVIMQLLLTEVTNKPFPKIMHDLVLEPAGMAHSTYEQPLPQTLAAGAATPYRDSGEPVNGGWHTYPEMAPAGLWTTPSDLARFAIEVQKEHAGKSSTILSQEMMRQMLSVQKDDFGLGFGLVHSGEALRFSHGGANEGFRCSLDAYARTGQGLVIMTNSDVGDRLIDEYRRAVAKEYGWPDFKQIERSVVVVDPKVLSHYAGTYEIPNTETFTITLKDSSLYLTVGGAAPEELFSESDSRFFVLSRNETFDFQKSNTQAAKLLLNIGTQTYEALRIP
jgi:CubicO group peptidase (beta-lactamase class C family)